MRLDFAGRGRLLRVRLHDGDQPPLELRGVTVRVPVERLVFEAADGRRYRLSYGRADRRPPSFEIQRTVADPAVWIAQAAQAYLGPPHRASAAVSKLPLWRHPLSWAAILLVLLMVSLVTGRRWLGRRRAVERVALRGS